MPSLQSETAPPTEAQTLLKLEHKAQSDPSVSAADAFRTELTAANNSKDVLGIYQQLSQSSDKANFSLVNESDGKQYIQFEDLLPGDSRKPEADADATKDPIKLLGAEIGKAFSDTAAGKDPGLSDPQLREDITAAYKQAMAIGPDNVQALTKQLNDAVPGSDNGFIYTPDESGVGGKVQFVRLDPFGHSQPVSDAINITPPSSQLADAQGIEQAIVSSYKSGGAVLGEKLAPFVQHQVDAGGGGGADSNAFDRVTTVLNLANAELEHSGYQIDTGTLNLGDPTVTGPDGKQESIDLNANLKLKGGWGVRDL